MNKSTLYKLIVTGCFITTISGLSYSIYKDGDKDYLTTKGKIGLIISGAGLIGTLYSSTKIRNLEDKFEGKKNV